MTYGVYTRDMQAVSLSGQSSIESCKKYLWRDLVVCSEKQRLSSWGIEILFHKWRGFHYWKIFKECNLGFMTFKIKSNYYTGADKIVYDPQKERKGGEK